MKNMQMRTKLMLCFLILVLLAVVIGVVGVVSLYTLKDNMTNDDMLQELKNPAIYTDTLVENVVILTDFFNEITDKQAAQAATDAHFATILMFVVLVAAVAASVFLCVYIANRICRPLSMMQDMLVQVGDTGSLNFRTEQLAALREEGKNRDEMGRSIRAFSKMLERFVYIGKNLNAVADGNLMAHIELLSEQDEMGNALKSTIGKLNDVFTDIKNVSGQMLAVSNEMEEGARQLAHGSFEQKASVDNVLLSVHDMACQADVGVDLARSSVQDSHAIYAIAQSGSEKMKSLSSAVWEMRSASYAFDDVAKIIDEISFSINILALNAAIQAAHAGSNGFSVIADEIRQLASKSAEAARKTAVMVSSNIQKADMGILISQEASDALQEIVAGVEHTTETLTTLAEQSECSRASAEQVNQEMQRLAQAAQTNSDTSEKNAATSEEASRQASVLGQFIGHFQLQPF